MKTFQEYMRLRESEEEEGAQKTKQPNGAAEYSPRSAKKHSYPGEPSALPADEKGREQNKNFLDLLKQYAKKRKKE